MSLPVCEACGGKAGGYEQDGVGRYIAVACERCGGTGLAPSKARRPPRPVIKSSWLVCTKCKLRKDRADIINPDEMRPVCEQCARPVMRRPPDATPLENRCRAYRITVAEYEACLRRQGYRCAICGKSYGDVPLVIDHDHATGKVRGLLCTPCNTGMGHLGDTLERIERARDYLASPPMQQLSPPIHAVPTSNL